MPSETTNNSNSNLQRLWSNLKDRYDMPEYDVFKEDMGDENNLRNLHKNLVKDNFDMPDYETFKSDMGFGSQPSSAPTQEKTETPQGATTETPSNVFTETQLKQQDIDLGETIPDMSSMEGGAPQGQTATTQQGVGAPEVQPEQPVFEVGDAVIGTDKVGRTIQGTVTKKESQGVWITTDSGDYLFCSTVDGGQPENYAPQQQETREPVKQKEIKEGDKITAETTDGEQIELTVTKKTKEGTYVTTPDGEEYLISPDGKEIKPLNPAEDTATTDETIESVNQPTAQGEEPEVKQDKRSFWNRLKGLFKEQSVPILNGGLKVMDKAEQNFRNSAQLFVDEIFAEPLVQDYITKNDLKQGNVLEKGRTIKNVQKGFDAIMDLLLDEAPLRAKIEQEANDKGYDLATYLENLHTILGQQFMNDYIADQIAKQRPKGAIDYLFNENLLAGGILGDAFKAIGRSPEQNQIAQMAREDYEDDISMWQKALGGGLKLASDYWVFAIGGPATKGVGSVITENTLDKVVKGYTERLIAAGANSIRAQELAEIRVANHLWARFKNELVENIVSNALLFGSYDAAEEALNEVALNGEVKEADVLDAALGGIRMGVLLGPAGNLSRAMTANLEGLQKLGAEILGFGAETAAFTTSAEIDAYKQTGEFIPLNQATLESAINLAAIKFTGQNPLLIKEAISNLRNAFKPTGNTGLHFDKEEQKILQDALGEADILPMMEELAILEGNQSGNGERGGTIDNSGRLAELRQQVADGVKKIATDPEIDYETRYKLVHALTGKTVEMPLPIISGYDITRDDETGVTTIVTRTADGQKIKTETYKSDEKADKRKGELDQILELYAAASQSAEEQFAQKLNSTRQTAASLPPIPQMITNTFGKERIDTQRANERLTPETIAELDENPAQALTKLSERAQSLPDGSKIKADAEEDYRVAWNYAYSKASTTGMREGLEQRTNNEIGRVNKRIDDITHHNENGGLTDNIIAVTTKGGEQGVISFGNMVVKSDGTIDREKSNSFLIMKDGPDGEGHALSIDDIQSVNVSSASQLKAQRVGEIRQERAQDFENDVNGKVRFVKNEFLTLRGEDGKPFDIRILGDATDKDGKPIEGQVVVQLADDSQTVMSREDIQRMKTDADNAQLTDEDFRKQVNELHNVQPAEEEAPTNEGNAPTNEENAPTEPAAYAVNDKITLKVGDDDVYGLVNSVDGDNVSFTTDKNVQFEGEDKAGVTHTLPADRLSEYVTEHIPANPAPETPTEPAPETPAEPETPAGPPTILQQITDKDGNIQWESVAPAQTLEALVEQAKGNKEIALEVAEGMAESAKKAVATAKGKVTRTQHDVEKAVADAQAALDVATERANERVKGNDPVKMIEEREARNKAVADAQDALQKAQEDGERAIKEAEDAVVEAQRKADHWDEVLKVARGGENPPTTDTNPPTGGENPPTTDTNPPTGDTNPPTTVALQDNPAYQQFTNAITERVKPINAPFVLVHSREEMLDIAERDHLDQVTEDNVDRINAFVAGKDKNKKIYFYLPNIFANGKGTVEGAMLDAWRRIRHEADVHYGLREMLGEEGYAKILNRTYKGMSDEMKERFLKYRWDNNYSDASRARLLEEAKTEATDGKTKWNDLSEEDKAKLIDSDPSVIQGAADEYIAHLAEEIKEGRKLTVEEKDLWDKILAWLEDIFGVGLTEEELTDLILLSHRNLEKPAEGGGETPAGGGEAPKWEDTQIGRRYTNQKIRHPEGLMLLDMDDHYELYGDDALNAAKALKTQATENEFGVPYLRIDKRGSNDKITDLIRAGYRINRTSLEGDEPEPEAGNVETAEQRKIRLATEDLLARMEEATTKRTRLALRNRLKEYDEKLKNGEIAPTDEQKARVEELKHYAGYKGSTPVEATKDTTEDTNETPKKESKFKVGEEYTIMVDGKPMTCEVTNIDDEGKLTITREDGATAEIDPKAFEGILAPLNVDGNVPLTPETAAAQGISETQLAARTPDWLGERNGGVESRKRGYRQDSGHIYWRKPRLKNIKIGSETLVDFGGGMEQVGRMALIELSDLQASHNVGAPNPYHFISEAQPKDRTKTGSINAALDNGRKLKNEQVIGAGQAYSGAPVINARGEVIQGNSRADALRVAYRNYPEKIDVENPDPKTLREGYRDQLRRLAHNYGLDPADVDRMENPVLVRLLDVNDNRAIELGKMRQQDAETGGETTIDAANAASRLGDDIQSVANILFNGKGQDTSEWSLSDFLSANGKDVLDYLVGGNPEGKMFISRTDYDSAFTGDDKVSVKAKDAIRDILFQSVFSDMANTAKGVFNGAAFPDKARKALYGAIFNDFKSPDGERLIPTAQEAIEAYADIAGSQFASEFLSANKERDVKRVIDEWRHSTSFNLSDGSTVIPSQKFSPFAIDLAGMFRYMKQNELKKALDEAMYITRQSATPDIFLGSEPIPLESAIKTAFHLPEDYEVKLSSKEAPKRDNDISFSIGDANEVDVEPTEVTDDEGRRSLVGIHNMSLRDIQGAMGLGGLTNPSTAIVDVDRGGHRHFGAYSLVAPSGLIDDITTRSGFTRAGDSYSATFPRLEDRDGKTYIAGTDIEASLKNISDYMNARAEANGNQAGIAQGSFLAPILKELNSLDEIRQQKGRLSENYDHDLVEFNAKWRGIKVPLIDKLGGEDGYGAGADRFVETIQQADPRQFAWDNFGINLTDGDVKNLQDYITAVQEDMPVRYFEAKANRPVYFNEFAGAVIPDDAPQNVVDFLENQGLSVLKYEAGNESDRLEKVRQLAEERGDVTFSIDNEENFGGNALENEENDVSLQGEGGNQPRYRGWEKRSVTINTSDYEPTDEFRGLQEECRSRGAEAVRASWSAEHLDEDTRDRLAGILRQQLESSGGANGRSDGVLGVEGRPDTQYTIHKNVSGKLFHDIFEIARSYLPNGELVDLHDNYDDCVCYLSEDGTSGFAIEQETGNLVSVFNLGVRRKFLQSISDYIKQEGATHLDAYSFKKQDLREIYGKTLGAKVASSMDYNMEYDHDDIAKNHGNPDVVFMYIPDRGENIDITERHFGKDDYDAAEGYANSFNVEPANNEEIEVRFSIDDTASNIGRNLGIDIDTTDEGRREQDRYVLGTGKVSLVSKNNRTPKDAERSILTAVTQRGNLREVFGTEAYNDFIDNIFQHSGEETRREITNLAMQNGLDFRKATEQYLADAVARDDFNTDSPWWRTIKRDFQNMLSDNGFQEITSRAGFGEEGGLSDNDLRYTLWKNYRNDGTNRGAMGVAEDVAMQDKLGVGNYAPIEEDVSFSIDDERTGAERTEDTINRLVDMMANYRDNLEVRNNAMQRISDAFHAIQAQGKYDRATVQTLTDAINKMIQDDLLDPSNGDVKRILSAVKNGMDRSVGGSETRFKDSIYKLGNVLADNQLRVNREALEDALKVQTEKVGTDRIKKQGAVDGDTAQIIRDLKKLIFGEATEWDYDGSDIKGRENKKQLDGRIKRASGVMDDPSKTELEKHQAELEFTAATLAKRYQEEVVARSQDRKTLRDEAKDYYDFLKKAVEDGEMTASKAKELRASYDQILQDKLLESKFSSASNLHDIAQEVTNIKNRGIAKAKNFFENTTREKQRQTTAMLNDMGDIPNTAQQTTGFRQRVSNSAVAQALSAPLLTYEQLFKLLGHGSADGKGYLYNMYVGGWFDAANKEAEGYQDSIKRLNDKAAELFGKGVRFTSLYSMTHKTSDYTLSFYDNYTPVKRKFTIGNLLYVYMVDKMTDGAMKLRRMGIDEEKVAEIKESLDPRLIELADWIQGEFLPQTRERYNETYKLMYGLSMDNIPNYVPLNILNNAIPKEDVLTGASLENVGKLSTVTSAIKARTINSLPIDLVNSDGLSIIFDHVEQMEHWNAFAPLAKSLNMLLGDPAFQDRIMNMTTLYGGGKTLLNAVQDVCRQAVGDYVPKRGGKLEKGLSKWGQSVASSKIAFRLNTALKQFISMANYIPDVDLVDFSKAIGQGFASIGGENGTWQWAMENLPLFRKRWESRTSGDTRLVITDDDFKFWRKNWVEKIRRWGITPNAFIDAFTVSVGAKAIYDTKYKQYIKDGYSEEQADKKAKQDAVLLYNQTQQSAEGAFISTMQSDRTVFSMAATLFRNASMSYTRQVVQSVRNLGRIAGTSKEKMIDNMKGQYLQDGLTEEQAQAAAERRYNRAIRQELTRLATFWYVAPFLWRAGGHWLSSAARLIPSLFGQNVPNADDEKQQWIDDAIQSLWGPLEGAPFGDSVSDEIFSLIREGKGSWKNFISYPFFDDVATAKEHWDNENTFQAINEAVNLAASLGVGANPQALEDAVAGMIDYCDSEKTARDALILLSTLTSMPHSQINKLRLDEMGLSGEEALRLTPQEFVERYADAQKMHNAGPFAPLMGEKESEKYTKSATNKVKEQLSTIGGSQLNKDYNTAMEQYSAMKDDVSAINTDLKADEENLSKEEFDTKYGEGVYSWLQEARRRRELTKCRELVVEHVFNEKYGKGKYAKYKDVAAEDKKLNTAAGKAENGKTKEETQALVKRWMNAKTPEEELNIRKQIEAGKKAFVEASNELNKEE